MTDGGLSVISEQASVFTGKITHAEKKIAKIGDKKKEDLEKLKYTIDEQASEIQEIKLKY